MAQSPTLTILPLMPALARLGEHLPGGGDGRVVGGGQVGGDHRVEVAGRQRVERGAPVDAGHVDQDVEPAERRDDLFDRPIGLVRLRQVGRDGQARARRVLRTWATVRSIASRLVW